MSTQVSAQAGASGAPLETVGPSFLVRSVVGPLTRVFNPLVLRRAGRQDFRMAAQIRHIGRRSGREYRTPVTVRRNADVALIALTFGSRSDWCQNVLAAGGCSLRTDGQDYAATMPELLTRRQARTLAAGAFNPVQRAAFVLLGIRQILVLRLTPAGT
jgi:deazaflavin-dependent oxidoreductase (nitroreductase family)